MKKTISPTTVVLLKRVLPAAALAALSFGAAAHVGTDAAEHHGVLAGFLHPLTGPDHLAAMLAVGLWSAVTTDRVSRMWVAPLSFAMLLLAGALLAQAGVVFPAIEPMIAASMLVLGLLLIARVHLPVAGGALLAGAFALFHGAAHGQELNGAGALLGMVAGTALLHVAGLAMGWAARRHSVWLPRVAGAVVALFGLGMGWSLLAA